MSFNPNSYSPAAMARVRMGWRRYLRPFGSPTPIAPPSAGLAAAIVVLN
jgi:hypothetical protein